MQATRSRLHLAPTFEWIVAAAFLVATLGVASLIVRELSTVPLQAPGAVEQAPPASPAALPDRAVSVPALLLMDGGQVRVGDTAERVSQVLGVSADGVREVADRGALGERITRFYEHRGTRFVLVLEPFERNGALRVAGIYLQ
jgi:hypothetical protein